MFLFTIRNAEAAGYAVEAAVMLFDVAAKGDIAGAAVCAANVALWIKAAIVA